MEPARMVETIGEGIDREPWRGGWHRTLGPADGAREIDIRYESPSRGGDGRIGALRLLVAQLGPVAPHDDGGEHCEEGGARDRDHDPPGQWFICRQSFTTGGGAP